MNWFYAQDGRQAGPVEDNELDRLVQTGAINGATLVWHSGLANWLPYSEARAAAPPAVSAPPPNVAGIGAANAVGLGAAPASAPVVRTPAVLDAGQVRCSECARAFAPDEVVQVEGLNVCAACKPILLQKLREGVRPTGVGTNFAGFWIRFGAWFIDIIIVQICAGLIGFVVGMTFASAMADPDRRTGVTLALQGVVILLAASYEVFFIANYGATPGKMACGIKVVRPDGSRLGFGRAVGRYFAKFLSGIILAIGYIMAAFDEEKRAMHDQICDTRVVVKSKVA